MHVHFFFMKLFSGKVWMLLALTALTAIGCRSGSKNAEAQPPQDLRPDWVRARPMRPHAYVAVGMSPKRQGLDYSGNARNQALGDIASQISVEISGNSLLYQLETNERYREDFQSSVRSSTKAQLEGYELIDQYETETEYWALYELDKDTHRRLSDLRLKKAVANALDLRNRARAEIDRGEDLLGLNSYIRSIEAVSEFWAQPVETEIDGQKVFLSNHLYSEFSLAVGSMKIKPIPASIELIRGLPLGDVGLSFALENARGRRIAQAPLFLHYSGDQLSDREVYTGSDGTVRAPVERVNSKKAQEKITATFNLVSLARLSSSSTTALIANSVRPPEAVMELLILPPKVHVSGEERVDGVLRKTTNINRTFEKLFAQNGSESVDRSKADLVLRYRANAVQMNPSAAATKGYVLKLEAELFDRNGKLIFRRDLGEVTGQHIDEQSAANLAFERMASEVERRYFRDLMRAAGMD